jgi:hypothetical protein
MRCTVAAALVLGASFVVEVAGDGAPVATAAPTEQSIATPGPLGAITVIGDSVMLGGLLVGPTIGAQLHARGWGPIRARAGEGYSTGAFATNTTWKATYWIQRWRNEGWDAPTVLVNLGANDSGICRADVACARNAILHLVDAIGPGRRIWWPKITRFYTYTDQANAWNAALDQIAVERADFFTWDWPTELRTGGYSSPDQTHLGADSYRKRSAVMARELTADLARAERSGADAPLAAVAGSPSRFVALPPGRVLDTRDGGAAPLAAGGSVAVDLSPYLPESAVAVAVGLTTDGSNAPGFLTGHACDRAPGDVSNVNHAAGVARGSMAIVPLSADRRLCVSTRAAGHVIVDLQGAFVTDGGSGFRPLEPGQRLLDTRQSGRAPILEVAVPEDAEAVAVNLTATGATEPGWLKAFPCGTEPPVVSNVNYYPGESVASLAYVPVSATGTICVETRVPADVIVDITGVFTDDAPLRFVPAVPTRALDSRSGVGGWAPMHGGGQTIDVRVAPPGAVAVTGTITMVAPLRPGFLTGYGCGPMPPTSSVNAAIDTVMANAATVGVSADGRLCIFALAATGTLFDVTGLVGTVSRAGRAAALLLGFSIATLSWSGGTAAAAPWADQHSVEAAGPDRRLYMITDSVGLGAAPAIRNAFAGWQVTIDADAGEFTETLERMYVAPRVSRSPGVFGDHADRGGGVQLPLLGPGPLRSQRRLDDRHTRARRRAARALGDAARGAPAGREPGGMAWRRGVEVVPRHGQRPSRGGARAAPQPHAGRLGSGGEPAGHHVRRDPSQQRRRCALRVDRPPVCRRGHDPTARRGRAPGDGARRRRHRSRRRQRDHHGAAIARLPHRVDAAKGRRRPPRSTTMCAARWWRTARSSRSTRRASSASRHVSRRTSSSTSPAGSPPTADIAPSGRRAGPTRGSHAVGWRQVAP